jgi:Mce-associated membrane protein
MPATNKTTERILPVTSEVRLEDDAGTGDRVDSDALDSDALDTGAGAADRTAGRDDEFDDLEDDYDEEGAGRGARLSIPLVPVLAVLLVLLLGGVAYLWFTRPSTSSVTTADYVDVLEAARSEVVDLTSFDYQTLDDDIAQARKITVGDLQKESVAQLADNRKQLTDQQAVVNTQVVGAGVTRANGSDGTVLLVIQSTQRTKAAAQPAIVRYRIQADLKKVDGRWLLSGITGR